MGKHRKRLLWSLALIFGLNILIITLVQTAQAATYRQGSSGQAVRTIQEKLVRWGYFDGPVDGIYGSKTEAAVKKFQQKNGLTADGVAGTATLKALGMTTTENGASSSQSNSVDLLARVISAEARGEPGGRRDPQPGEPPLLPQHHRGSGLSAGRLLLHGRWADRPAGGRILHPGRPGGAQRRRPQRRSHLLF